MTYKQNLQIAFNKSFKGGISGALSQSINVFLFMWLRTIMNHQYATGNKFIDSGKFLYGEGGIKRFYKGIGWALLLSPMYRLCDVLTNDFCIELFGQKQNMLRSVYSSIMSSGMKTVLLPVDQYKTAIQVNGDIGKRIFIERIKEYGPKVLFRGGVANLIQSNISNYPWWVTYNILQKRIPLHVKCRDSLSGFIATFVSDILSNSLRNIKVRQQQTSQNINDTVKSILNEDGLNVLLFNGLKAKLVCNCLQGTVFTTFLNYIRFKL